MNGMSIDEELTSAEGEKNGRETRPPAAILQPIF
jgi:hypothetical protein